MKQAFRMKYAALAGLAGPIVAMPLTRIAPYWLAWLIGGAAMGLVMQFGMHQEQRKPVWLVMMIIIGAIAAAVVAGLVHKLLE